MISKLPLEMLTSIFKYLDIKSIKCVTLVSKEWRQEGLRFFNSGVMMLNPERWKTQIKSEVIKSIGKLRFRGYVHTSNEINEVLEILMQHSEFRYQRLDFVGQNNIDLRNV